MGFQTAHNTKLISQPDLKAKEDSCDGLIPRPLNFTQFTPSGYDSWLVSTNQVINNIIFYICHIIKWLFHTVTDLNCRFEIGQFVFQTHDVTQSELPIWYRTDGTNQLHNLQKIHSTFLVNRQTCTQEN